MDRLPLAHFAVVLPGAVTAERCTSLRHWLEGLGFSATGTAYPAGYRDNDRRVHDDEALAREFWSLPALQRALAALEPFCALGSEWRPVAANVRFRACRYEGGQSFTRHRDGAFSPSASRRTFLTAQLYLDEGFRGGATRFYASRDDHEPVAIVVPRQGSLVLFDHRAWHDGEAVVEGRKHVLRTDIVFERLGAGAAPPAGARFDVPGAPYVFSIVARRDGTLGVGTRDGRVLVLAREQQTLRLLRTIELGQSSVTALTEDRAGLLYAGSRGGVVTRVGENGGELVWQSPSAITALAVDGRDRLVVGTADGQLTRRATSGDIQSLGRAPGWIWALSTRGDETLVASEAGLFRALADEGLLAPLDDRPVRAVAQDERGDVFTGDAAGVVRGPHGLEERAHRGAVDALVGDGRGGFVSAGEDGAVVHGTRSEVQAGRWDLVQRAVHDDFARAIACLPDGTIVSGGYDGSVRLAAPENASERRKIATDTPASHQRHRAPALRGARPGPRKTPWPLAPPASRTSSVGSCPEKTSSSASWSPKPRSLARLPSPSPRSARRA